MRFDTFIFDFDFTLADASKGIIESFNYSFEKLNKKKPLEEAIRQTIGMTLEDAYIILTNDNDEADIDNFKKFFREKADEVMTNYTELFPDTMNGLKFLKDKNIKLGIVTTKYRYRIEECLKKHNCLEMIDTIVGGEDVKKAKPSPEGLILAMNTLKSNSDQVLYIGDHTIDAETAQVAGVSFAALVAGTTKKESFREYNPLCCVQSLAELITQIFYTNTDSMG